MTYSDPEPFRVPDIVPELVNIDCFYCYLCGTVRQSAQHMGSHFAGMHSGVEFYVGENCEIGGIIQQHRVRRVEWELARGDRFEMLLTGVVGADDFLVELDISG